MRPGKATGIVVRGLHFPFLPGIPVSLRFPPNRFPRTQPPPFDHRPCWHCLDSWKPPVPGFLLFWKTYLLTHPLSPYTLIPETHPSLVTQVKQRIWDLELENLGSNNSSVMSWLCDPEHITLLHVKSLRTTGVKEAVSLRIAELTNQPWTTHLWSQ